MLKRNQAPRLPDLVPRDRRSTSGEEPEAQNPRPSLGHRGMFDRLRRDRERMPGDTQTKHGGPDMRTRKKKGYTAQLTWREKPERVDKYKLNAHSLGMTLSEYALWAEAVIDQLSKEAKAAGVPLRNYVKSRLGIGRQEPEPGGGGTAG